jgi:hypothetical protein
VKETNSIPSNAQSSVHDNFDCSVCFVSEIPEENLFSLFLPSFLPFRERNKKGKRRRISFLKRNKERERFPRRIITHTESKYQWRKERNEDYSTPKVEVCLLEMPSKKK